MSVSLVIYLRVSFKYGGCDYEVRYNHIVAVEINKALVLIYIMGTAWKQVQRSAIH